MQNVPIATDNPEPLVSICIPVYNSEQLIHRALESCLRQTYQNIEIVIVDNASTDHTNDVVLRYAAHDNRIRYFRNDERVPIPESFSQSFRFASGTYVQMLHADDWLSQNYVEEGIKNFRQYPDTAAVVSKMITLTPQGKAFGFLTEDILPKKRYSADSVAQAIAKDPDWNFWAIVCLFAMMRKTDADDYGIDTFDDPFYKKLYQLGNWIDPMFFIKILMRHGYCVVTDKSAYLKLDHPDNSGKWYAFKGPVHVFEYFQEGREAFEILYKKELKKYLLYLRASFGARTLGTVLLHHAGETFRAKNFVPIVKGLRAFFSDYSGVEKCAVLLNTVPSLAARVFRSFIKKAQKPNEFHYEENYFLTPDGEFISFTEKVNA